MQSRKFETIDKTIDFGYMRQLHRLIQKFTKMTNENEVIFRLMKWIVVVLLPIRHFVEFILALTCVVWLPDCYFSGSFKQIKNVFGEIACSMLRWLRWNSKPIMKFAMCINQNENPMIRYSSSSSSLEIFMMWIFVYCVHLLSKQYKLKWLFVL